LRIPNQILVIQFFSIQRYRGGRVSSRYGKPHVRRQSTTAFASSN
jgi:hypothetical protein